MAAGGGGGKLWIGVLVAGGVMLGAAKYLALRLLGPLWLQTALLAIGGLAVVFGSCEAMIKSVEGMAARAKMNQFVAGTMAGLASNVPELVMLGFVLAAEPRVGFIVAVLTLHVGVAGFGIYSGLLPRDAKGHAHLPLPLVKLSTDLYACAAALFFSLGGLMVMMKAFGGGNASGGASSSAPALGATDLYVIGGVLLAVEFVAISRLVKRFSADEQGEQERGAEGDAQVDEQAAPSEQDVPSIGSIILYGLLGIGTSVVGGHAVGDFAGILVGALAEAGHSEMVGALILSVFACAGAFVMTATAHVKGMYDIALANVSGAITQVPFVILPAVMILLAALAQAGVVPMLDNGGVLVIDLETTSVLFLGFPSMLILWKAVLDDGKVNWLETATMVAIFGLTIYFLAVHG